MCGKRPCMLRSTFDSTVPSPTPASNTRTAGGRGWMLCSSSETRFATTHFSEQVLTNSRYFCRLSKKRKLGCGSGPPLGEDEVEAGAIDGDMDAMGVVLNGAIGRGAEGRSDVCVRAITAGRAVAFRLV